MANWSNIELMQHKSLDSYAAKSTIEQQIRVSININSNSNLMIKKQSHALLTKQAIFKHNAYFYSI